MQCGKRKDLMEIDSEDLGSTCDVKRPKAVGMVGGNPGMDTVAVVGVDQPGEQQ